jgi:hypothetical protein
LSFRICEYWRIDLLVLLSSRPIWQSIQLVVGWHVRGLWGGDHLLCWGQRVHCYVSDCRTNPVRSNCYSD